VAGSAEGTAAEYYTQEMADKCLKYATSILNHVEKFLAR